MALGLQRILPVEDGPQGGERFRASDLAAWATIALAYFAAARFGFLLAFATKQVTAVWPPTGIALAAYLVFGPRAWPGVFLGAFLANAFAHEPLGTAAGIAAGNTAQGLAGLLLLRRAGFDPALERVRDVLALILLGAMAGCAVSATNGVIQLALGGIIPWSATRSVWWVWWVGDAMGVLLVTPLLLLWKARPRLDVGARRMAELGALLLVTGLVCHLALSGRILRSSPLFRFEYAVFPCLIWAGLRFTQREAASMAVLVAAFAIGGAIHDRGPFATGTLDERLILLEVFMAASAVTGLTLGAVTAERRRAEGALQQTLDHLELRVQERTAQLAKANQDLAKKNEEVEAFVYIVSHDLRGPLVNLQGFSKELDSSCAELEAHLGSAPEPRVQAILKEDVPGALRFISASATKLQRLIDALLVLSRVGRQEYRSDPVDVQGLVSTTLDSLHASIQQRGTEVLVGDLPAARGDLTALGQVFSNLIENALKYLHPGRPGRIEVGGEPQEGMVHYWVRDNGSGIPDGAKRRLFQVFQRFHPDLAPGEGMGLALLKRIVERHGGRIWADSQEGQGTTFHFTLPAADTKEGEA